MGHQPDPLSADRRRGDQGRHADGLALPKQTIQALVGADKLGWHPKPFIAAVSIDPFVMSVARLNTNGRATEGAMSITFLKDDPISPVGAATRREAVLLNPQEIRPGQPKAVANIYGWPRLTRVDVPAGAGARPGRASQAATSPNRHQPVHAPGADAEDVPDRRFGRSSRQMYRYTRGTRQVVGPIVPARHSRRLDGGGK
jgi:hypothetical protein